MDSLGEKIHRGALKIRESIPIVDGFLGSVENAHQGLLDMNWTKAAADTVNFPAVLSANLFAGTVEALNNYDPAPLVQGINETLTAWNQDPAGAFISITDALFPTPEELAVGFNNLDMQFTEQMNLLAEDTTTWANPIEQGIAGAFDTVSIFLPEKMKNLVSAAGENIGEFFSVGEEISDGLASGITSNQEVVAAAARAAVRAAIIAARTSAQIQSPSRVFSKIGQQMMLGLSGGIDESAYLATDSVTSAVRSMTPSAGIDGDLNRSGMDMSMLLAAIYELPNRIAKETAREVVIRAI